MVLPLLGHPHRAVYQIDLRRRALLLRLLNAPLHVAHGLEIFVDALPVCRRDIEPQPREVRRHHVEEALVHLDPGQPRGRVALPPQTAARR